MKRVVNNPSGGYALQDAFGNQSGKFATMSDAFNKLLQQETNRKQFEQMIKEAVNGRGNIANTIPTAPSGNVSASATTSIASAGAGNWATGPTSSSNI